jgi:HD superfamily phosphohydrolase
VIKLILINDMILFGIFYVVFFVQKNRIIRDPIYGFISLSYYEFIQGIIDNPYFQRLRRLSQLGVSSYVYPTATHSRLNHSLGAMELFIRLFDHLFENPKEKKEDVEQLRKTGIASILLHDIGHGPFSHASEKIFGFKHEAMTEEIIQNTDGHDAGAALVKIASLQQQFKKNALTISNILQVFQKNPSLKSSEFQKQNQPM